VSAPLVPTNDSAAAIPANAPTATPAATIVLVSLFFTLLN
jgi:hypothetical protein